MFIKNIGLIAGFAIFLVNLSYAMDAENIETVHGFSLQNKSDQDVWYTFKNGDKSYTNKIPRGVLRLAGLNLNKVTTLDVFIKKDDEREYLARITFPKKKVIHVAFVGNGFISKGIVGSIAGCSLVNNVTDEQIDRAETYIRI